MSATRAIFMVNYSSRRWMYQEGMRQNSRYRETSKDRRRGEDKLHIQGTVAQEA